MLVLVVGANGQLGSRCCAELMARGHDVRGSVRQLDRGRGLAQVGVDVVQGDLAAPEGLEDALDGVDAVVLSANPIAPRKGDDPAAVERGMLRLVDEAEAAGVGRFVLVSVPQTHLDAKIPFVKARRELEQRLIGSTLDQVIVRFPPFMECWLALVGSSIPLRDEPYATIGRPSPFLRMFRRATASLVEDRGLMLVPGSPRIRNAFIAESDVARACAAAVEQPELRERIIEIGGPEVLSWAEVAEIYGRLLGRKIRMLSTPAAVYAGAATVLAPIAAVPSGTMSLNYLLAATETVWPAGGGVLDPASMTTVAQFLEEKAGLSRELPTVT